MLADTFYPCGGIVVDPVKSTESLVSSRAKKTGVQEYECAASLVTFLGKQRVERWMEDHGFAERWAKESAH